MSFAPRITERLLEALCPPSPFRDGVLGDLAEEFASRRCSNGPLPRRLAARLWYYRQALASAPHLLAHWALRVTFGRWIGVMLFGTVAMIVAKSVVTALQVAAVTWWAGVPDSMGFVIMAWRDMREAYPVFTFFAVNMIWPVGVLAGHVAARLNRDAPMAAAGAAAITPALIFTPLILVQGSFLPVFVFWFNIGLWMLCMLTGGASYVLLTRRRDEHLYID